MFDTTTMLPDIKLQFNLDHPSYEECYSDGYECAVLGIEEEENPFRDGSKESEQWLEGWWAGTFGDEPLFDMSALEESRLDKEIAANDQLYCQKHSFLSLVFEISGAIAASAIVGYQILELVA